ANPLLLAATRNRCHPSQNRNSYGDQLRCYNVDWSPFLARRSAMSRQSRRTFLKQAAGAAAAFSVLPMSARADVNSQIRMATIGFNGRGKSHIDGFKDQLVALCDCDSKVLGQTADAFYKSHNRKLDQISDYRRLLDRKDIDAI